MGKIHVTMALDENLLKAVDAMVAERKQSRNQFVIEAVKRMLRELERERTDAAFAQMAEDAFYQAELRHIEQEMASASDTAWRQLEAAEPCQSQD